MPEPVAPTRPTKAASDIDVEDADELALGF
jgi:hypothetical protein